MEEVDDVLGTPPPSSTAPPLSKTSMASRLLSPTSFHLGSNDDQLERAQARAARAAAVRRKSVLLSQPPAPADSANALFDRDQIMELYHNCIKLASENKINQKNTWELGLIDHLSEIIQVESEDESETNFQKASCTLEAGVKIYSLRVDSVHSEAYKVLGGINRAGRGDDKGEDLAAGDDIQGDQEEDRCQKEMGRKISPLSTLESSFEALNVKKFDVAFTVDPLYHQTSAQFDEGGARGLLLYNLGVYAGCRVLFDSCEAPNTDVSCETEEENSALIDLSFARECIEHMMNNLSIKSDISPTLRDIVSLLDEDHQRPLNGFSEMHSPVGQNVVGHIGNDPEVDASGDYESWSFDQDDCTSAIDGNSMDIDPNSKSHQQENEDYAYQDHDADEKIDNLADFLSLELGFTSKSNAWAGPDHWKYHKVKGMNQVPESVGESELPVKTRNRKAGHPDLDFTKSLHMEMPDIFAPPKNPKSLLLPVKRAPCNVTLPEDCHYRPESLVSLLVLPNIMCLGKKRRKSSDQSKEHACTYDPSTSWDNQSIPYDNCDDGNVCSDEEDPGSLVRQPRQVNKVDIQYDKVSKQVDVQALKESLWGYMQLSVQAPDKESTPDAAVSFRQILHQFPNESATASVKDVSPHLFFICLLHLANEHCLSIHDHPSLDELDIYVPPSAPVS